MMNAQIEAARNAYFDASWALYDAMISEREKRAARKEILRRELLALDPGHFVKYERMVFEETVRKYAKTPEDADRRIAKYVPSDRAQELDRL